MSSDSQLCRSHLMSEKGLASSTFSLLLCSTRKCHELPFTNWEIIVVELEKFFLWQEVAKLWDFASSKACQYTIYYTCVCLYNKWTEAATNTQMCSEPSQRQSRENRKEKLVKVWEQKNKSRFPNGMQQNYLNAEKKIDVHVLQVRGSFRKAFPRLTFCQWIAFKSLLKKQLEVLLYYFRTLWLLQH